MGFGTAINATAVLAGGGIATLVGASLPEAIRHTAMQIIGIATLLVGIANFLKYGDLLVPLVSVVAGLVVELLGIEDALRRFGERLEKRFARGRALSAGLSSRRAYYSVWVP